MANILEKVTGFALLAEQYIGQHALQAADTIKWSYRSDSEATQASKIGKLFGRGACVGFASYTVLKALSLAESLWSREAVPCAETNILQNGIFWFSAISLGVAMFKHHKVNPQQKKDQ